jgi:hypothetical protein
VKLQISKASGALRWPADVHYVEVSTKQPVPKSPYKPNVHISQKYCHAWLVREQQIKQTNNGMA